MKFAGCERRSEFWMSRNYFQPRQSNQRAQLVKETFISEVLGSNPA